MRWTPIETATASRRLAATKRVEGVCEVEERVSGLASVDAVLVAESGDRVGEACALLWGVDLFVDVGERVPAPVCVVVFDRFA